MTATETDDKMHLVIDATVLLARFAVAILSVGLMALGASAASGQNYPNKPIRMVTGEVGGGPDYVARLIARGISGPLGQQVIVDNRPTGIIPADIVSKAPPDGYTCSSRVTSYGLLRFCRIRRMIR
jgi:tripartite-type tricarboxylate transporter receptor subunit TctC